jgi:pimeloyl-ACP methyl ester carboxylesterase
MTDSFWLAAAAAGSLAIRRVRIDGVDTRVLEAGDPDAPALVCLHGTGGHAEAFTCNPSPPWRATTTYWPTTCPRTAGPAHRNAPTRSTATAATSTPSWMPSPCRRPP